jgi:hypothetical protein
VQTDNKTSSLRLSKLLCDRIEKRGYSAIIGPSHRTMRKEME